MKKTVVIIASALLAFSSAQATINVNFGVFSGAIANTGGTTAGDLFTGTSLIQLIWSTVNTYSSTATAVGGGVDAASYYVLWSGTLTGGFGGGDLDGSVIYSNADVGANNINAGYIYGRVFNTDTPAIGSFYANSDILSTALFADASGAPPPPADTLDLISGPSAVYDGGADVYMLPMNLEIVPEPSVLAFLGLGGLALAARRRFVA